MSAADTRAALAVAEAAGILRTYGYTEAADKVAAAAQSIALSGPTVPAMTSAASTDWTGPTEQHR